MPANAKSEGAEGGFIAEGSLSTDGLCSSAPKKGDERCQ